MGTKGEMTMSVSSLKRHSLLPVAAFVSAFLLVTGQALSCCCPNEGVSDKVSQAFTALSGKLHPAASPENAMHCAGHEMPAESGTSGVVTAGANHCMAAGDECMPSSSLAAKVMVGSEFSSSWTLPIVLERMEVARALVSLHLEPLPQNKSSPPLYLSTLHILV